MFKVLGFVATFFHDQKMKTGGLDVELAILEKDFLQQNGILILEVVFTTHVMIEERSGTIITFFQLFMGQKKAN